MGKMFSVDVYSCICVLIFVRGASHRSNLINGELQIFIYGFEVCVIYHVYRLPLNSLAAGLLFFIVLSNVSLLSFAFPSR